MKKILFLFALLVSFFCFNLEIQAAPFVVSDAYPAASVQPDGFSVSVDGGAVVESAPDIVTSTTCRLKFDVGAVTSGAHTIRVKAFKDDPVWGRLESAEAVFTFTRPAAPSGPSGIKLQP